MSRNMSIIRMAGVSAALLAAGLMTSSALASGGEGGPGYHHQHRGRNDGGPSVSLKDIHYNSNSNNQNNHNNNTSNSNSNGGAQIAILAGSNSADPAGFVFNGAVQNANDSGVTINGNTKNNANITNGSYNNSSGQFGVNVVSGSNNEQGNTAVVSSNGLAGVTGISQNESRMGTTVGGSNNMEYDGRYRDHKDRGTSWVYSNASSINGSFVGAVGAYGVNVAAGNTNLQSNVLSVSCGCTQ